ncbi:MAG TPA: C1 family peptidase [Elusimicrobiota bacterium]|nr:C1 family peptidase [Elusimicrobiota bacterium]
MTRLTKKTAGKIWLPIFCLALGASARAGEIAAGSDAGIPPIEIPAAGASALAPAALLPMGTAPDSIPAALPDLAQDNFAVEPGAAPAVLPASLSELAAVRPSAEEKTAAAQPSSPAAAMLSVAPLSAAMEPSSARPTQAGKDQDSRRKMPARRQLVRMSEPNLRADLFDGAAALSSARAPLPSERGISPKWIEQMRLKDAQEVSAGDKRLRDAAQRLGFSKVALNREVIENHTDKYTVELPAGTITNQKNSGRCWIFAGLNMIRSTLFAEKRLPGKFEFSQNYLYFFSLLEQANMHLGKAVGAVAASVKEGAKISASDLREELSIQDKVEDGGWFEYFQFLASKYGLVPESAMPETKSSQNSGVLLQEMSLSLAQSINEALEAARRDPAAFDAKAMLEARALALSRIWKVLVTHLGTPPERFEFRQEGRPVNGGLTRQTPAEVSSYTPLEFAEKFVRFNPDDYVVLANSPGKKSNEIYIVKDSAIGEPALGRPAPNARFLNVSLNRLERLVVASISAGHPVWIAADVDHDMDPDTGIMHPKIYQKNPIYGFVKEEKPKELTRTQATYLMVRSPDHAMAITGVDQPNAKAPVIKYKVENSWGSRFGSRGIFHMYRQWFRDNLYEIVVHKSLLSPAEKKALKGPAKEISEDEMF